MWATVIHASALAMDVSQSLASLRHRPSQAVRAELWDTPSRHWDKRPRIG